jgi:hypothetical protein
MATHNTDIKKNFSAYPKQWRRNGGMAEARPLLLLLLLHLMMALGPTLQQILLGVEPDTTTPTPTSGLSHESQQGRVPGGRNSGRWARSLHLSNLKIFQVKGSAACFWDSRIRIQKSEIRILLPSSKNSKKNVDSYCFVLL